MNQKTIRILLADDDEDDRMMFRDAIMKVPLKTQVETVNDGVELLQYLANSSRDLPHILFLDLNMPRKNGLECLKEIRSKENLRDLSVAIYSTSNAEKDVEEAFVSGANIYINKPNDFGCLKKVLTKVLSVNWQYVTSGMDRDTFLLSV
ncbi:response regulator [Echinicola strongylocentroti]|uniref:Response regulator n=1 Tax=Echinicola strongylocentroti TaxID=1795355 RepID=A0A2Z4IN12_9BACT|nr:response regulator [Echinicola strongylocentroti]AWW32018.1 response regulator [Echinicola strongylocentroti]